MLTAAIYVALLFLAGVLAGYALARRAADARVTAVLAITQGHRQAPTEGAVKGAETPAPRGCSRGAWGRAAARLSETTGGVDAQALSLAVLGR